ncbi:MAG: phosphate/phosphite/phosphonate ABC transporter substrate-binding protein [Nitrospirota bacterium]|nr:phosphate/phosphite/phosphonate ABC transporter substrate-binding protein [Nitrospirota bacterium]
MRKKLISFVLFGALLSCSCQNTAAPSLPPPKNDQQDLSGISAGPALRISIIPAESAASLYGRLLPLKYSLEHTLKRRVTIKIAKDYDTIIREIGNGQIHIACLDPSTYCEARARYGEKVIPLVKTAKQEGELSRSVLIVKQDRGMEKIVELKGKRIAFGHQRSTFGHLAPLAMLKDVGIGAEDFAAVDHFQQEDSVALSVLIGDHDAGALSQLVAEKYLADGLTVLKKSEEISRLVLCASRDLSPATRELIVRGLVAPPDAPDRERTKDGQIGRFTPAQDRDFDAVRVMIKNLSGKNYIEYGPNTIKVAILPLYSAITLFERYDPLMRYLSRKTGYEFKLVIPRDFEEFVEVVKKGNVNFSYQNPYVFSLIDRTVRLTPLVTTIGEEGATAGEGAAGDRFRGVIITRADSKIRTVEDLRGKNVLVVSAKSAGGYLSQKLFLQQRGISVERDLMVREAKRQENVILGVYKGQADAGFVRESALEVLKGEIDMRQIRVLTRTQSLPNWPFSLCGKTNPSLVKKVARLLVDLNDRNVLGAAKIRGFRASSDAEFEGLRQY